MARANTRIKKFCNIFVGTFTGLWYQIFEIQVGVNLAGLIMVFSGGSSFIKAGYILFALIAQGAKFGSYNQCGGETRRRRLKKWRHLFLGFRHSEGNV